MKRVFARKTDLWILLLALLVLAAWLLLRPQGGGERAEILLDGVVVERLPLDKERDFTVPGLPEVRLAVRGGACGFMNSDCPDQICVHSGFLRTPGQTAACLPNRVVLRIAADDAGLDATLS